MKKPGRREVKWFAHGHTDSVGQNHGCISDCLTPGCGLFVLYFIAACSWCHFGKRVSRGLSNMDWEWEEELQEAQESWNHESSGQAGTSKGRRIKLCKGRGKFWYRPGRKQYWGFTGQQVSCRNKYIELWHLRFEISILVRAGLQLSLGWGDKIREQRNALGRTKLASRSSTVSG